MNDEEAIKGLENWDLKFMRNVIKNNGDSRIRLTESEIDALVVALGWGKTINEIKEYLVNLRKKIRDEDDANITAYHVGQNTAKFRLAGTILGLLEKEVKE